MPRSGPQWPKKRRMATYEDAEVRPPQGSYTSVRWAVCYYSGAVKVRWPNGQETWYPPARAPTVRTSSPECSGEEEISDE